MLQGIKKVFEGLLFSLGLGIALRVVSNIFLAGFSFVLGKGAIQLSGAESWIWARLFWPGVIGPFEIAVLAMIAGVILPILLLIFGLLRILVGVLGILSASKNAVFGNAATATPEPGHPGLAFVLGIVGALIAVAILTGAAKAALGFISGLTGSVSAAAVGGTSALFVACAILLVFGALGFFATLVLLVREIFR